MGFMTQQGIRSEQPVMNRPRPKHPGQLIEDMQDFEQPLACLPAWLRFPMHPTGDSSGTRVEHAGKLGLPEVHSRARTSKSVRNVFQFVSSHVVRCVP